MLDWLIVSVIYFLPMLAVVVWLAVAVPRLMVSREPPPAMEDAGEANNQSHSALSRDDLARLDYFKGKERRDQAVLDTVEDSMEFLKSAIKRGSEEELSATATLLGSIKQADEAAPRQKQKETEIGS